MVIIFFNEKSYGISHILADSKMNNEDLCLADS